MKKALIWTAQLGAGVGCGILLSYNMNQVYYFSIRRHVYVPVKSEWEQEHKDWDQIMGTLRKGVGDCFEELRQ